MIKTKKIAKFKSLINSIEGILRGEIGIKGKIS